MEEFKVPVLYTGVSNGTLHDPNSPPNFVTLRGHTYFYHSSPDKIEDLFETLDRLCPMIRKYLSEKQWSWSVTADFIYVQEFDQWQIATYIVFPSPGEGIIFAMWMAEQNFDDRSSPFRQGWLSRADA